MKRRGFSLVELMLGCTLLGLLTTALFALLSLGMRSFQTASVRAGGRADLQAAMEHLQQDIEQSTVAGATTETHRQVDVRLEGAVARNRPRHLMCLPGKLQWESSAGFNAERGNPIWDCYWVYHADLSERGSLSRLELLPTGSTQPDDLGWDDFPTYISSFPDMPPARGATVANFRVNAIRRLTQNLLSFEVLKSTDGIKVSLVIRNTTQSLHKGQRREELLATDLQIVCRNTPP